MMSAIKIHCSGPVSPERVARAKKSLNLLITLVFLSLAASLYDLQTVASSPLILPLSGGVCLIMLGYVFHDIGQKKKGERKGAILYFSLTGNPTHPGHLDAIACAIPEFRKVYKMPIHKVLVSLSQQTYMAGKVTHRNKELAKKDMAPHIALSKLEREGILTETIDVLGKQGRFDKETVEYWDDQTEGEREHFDTYVHLKKKNPDRLICFISGSDLCRSLNKSYWKGKIDHAIIVTRGRQGDPESTPEYQNGHLMHLKDTKGHRFVSREITKTFSRVLVENPSSSADLSSSRIQAGDLTLLVNDKCRDIFQKALSTDPAYQAYLQRKSPPMAA